jgi:hypothetical protein
MFICFKHYSQTNRVTSSNGSYLEGAAFAHTNENVTYTYYTTLPNSGYGYYSWSRSIGAITIGTTFKYPYRTMTIQYPDAHAGLKIITTGGLTVSTRYKKASQHIVNGRYMVYNHSSYQTLHSANYIPQNSSVQFILNINSDIESFSWQNLTPNAGTVTYNNSTRTYSFQTTGNGNQVVFRFTYNWGCCTTTEDYIFRIVSSYSVFSNAGSGVLLIKPENESKSANHVRLSGKYEIVDIYTGIIKKSGLLIPFSETSIDVSNLSSGIYIVRVIFGDTIQGYKVSISN